MKIAACVLGVAALLAFRYYVGQEYRQVMAAATSREPSSCVVMVGNTRTEENGHTYIAGTIRNNCGRPVGHVTVSFKVERQPDAAFSSDAPAYAYVSDVAAGETRSFKTLFQIPKDTGYRFDGITAF